jgi:long-subunit fatty acid transport protein
MSALQSAPRRGARRRAVRATTAIVAVASWIVLRAAVAAGSTLLSPAGGARDAALAGATVAAPTDLMSAFFENPAGLSLLEGAQATGGAGFFIARSDVHTPFGYRGDSHSVGMAPSFGAATARDRWRFGVGMFGSIGSKFDFPADPEHGVARNFYAELGAITIAPTVAYQVTPDLAVGAQINPLFGTLTNRVPTPDQHLRWRVQGPGIQGVVGILYTPLPDWRLGLTYKTPGRIFMKGSVGVAGDREDLRFTFHVPQQVFLGAAWHPTPCLALTAVGQWSDTSAFERSRFEFSRTPALNFAFAPKSHDVLRGGAGIEYQAHPRISLRAGFARNQAALEPRSVTPLVYDVSGFIIGGGFGVDLGRWIVDLTSGVSVFDDRKINGNEARVFPGRYSSNGPVVYAQLTRRF